MGKKKPVVYYMHTLNGSPAAFAVDQICYAVSYGRPNKLCRNLAEIRKERRRSIRWRTEQGIVDPPGSEDKYGYVRVALP